MPKVSILIPVYNREAYVGECIQSALDQTYSDFEIVIADNASTDRTWEICRQYAAKDNRIRLFHNETNIGPVRNWLRCLGEAQGEYAKLLFSDDTMFPRFLEHTLPYLQRHDVAFVSTAASIGSSVAGGVIGYSLPDMAPVQPVKRYFKLLLEGLIPYSPGAALFRTADMRANLRLSFPTCAPRDFTKNGAGPDVLLYALTALNYEHVAMLPVADVFFRMHADSFTISDRESGVTMGYWAALAWFSKLHLTKHDWMGYVARTWLFRVKRTHSPVSLTRHTREHEGTGSTLETVTIAVMAVRIAFVWLLRLALGRRGGQS